MVDICRYYIYSSRSYRICFVTGNAGLEGQHKYMYAMSVKYENKLENLETH